MVNDLSFYSIFSTFCSASDAAPPRSDGGTMYASSSSNTLFCNGKHAFIRGPVEKFAHPIYWRDVNLRGNHYPHKAPFISLKAFAVPNLHRIPFAEATRGEFIDARTGQSWGPTWATVWFRVDAQVPAEWKDQEVHLLWDAGCEALVWSVDGAPLQGLYGGGGDDRRAEYILTRAAKGGDKFSFYIEMACNEVDTPLLFVIVVCSCER